ncbi:succinylglutamate desuccinylase/aspartoacylase family protein [Hanstruepera ponticola]|uniref:succinylglutamate desuccinylase/aspartoacylase family protein n=1 Tax=Hanstruepera ponticola TaxID=2042995 RepID=UPI000CF0F6C2|nr:succinylglutamate desuccinylase/aspartoacylase family protein [Hanstruepera ponticola]
MVEVSSPALKEIIKTHRIIGKIKGNIDGPTVVFFGGIHGNETAGVFALNHVFNQINPKDVLGTIFAITGNIQALKQNKRYINEDLNRLWFEERINSIKKKTNLNYEEKELIDLYHLIHNIIETESGPFYFIDFHTTSSKTIPFITINDALINRKFSMLFPVPIVLGIEEYLEGPLLSYVNQLGYVSLGFESGQHNDKDAVINSQSFIYLALLFTKAIKPDADLDFQAHYKQLLEQCHNIQDAFEINYLHRIKPEDNFKMVEGFKSFEKIRKEMVLATDVNGKITPKQRGRIFMPLYQKIGAEGFFIIKPIKPFFLKLSEFLRRVKFDNFLVILPGVSWESKHKQVLVVNLKIARFLAKSFFHLLGYRTQKIDATHLRLSNREWASKNIMYKNEDWY